jgi:hypothetical protein
MIGREHPNPDGKGGTEMSLKGQLKEFDVSRKRPPEVMAIIRRGIDHVRESGAAGLQKYALRGRPELMKEYEAIYPSFSDFLGSRAVTRVNGYVAGYGTCETLPEDLDGLGLSPAGRKRLEDLVCPPEARKGRSREAACPGG